MEGEATGLMDTILTAATKAIEFSGDCLTAMVGNEIYAFIFGAGIVGVGLMLVRKLKKTAKN